MCFNTYTTISMGKFHFNSKSAMQKTMPVPKKKKPKNNASKSSATQGRGGRNKAR